MSLRFKRNIGLPVMLALLATALVLGMGDQPVVAYGVRSSGQALEQSISADNGVALQMAAAAQSAELAH